MVLNSMLSNSPVFLFIMSASLLALYGVLRLVEAGRRVCGRWLQLVSHRSTTAHS
jgi:hypothetical protein